MKTPYFSIIIPTYNSGKTLSGCLDSIVSQSFKNFEVIVVDGDSSDNILLIVKRYAQTHPYIRWISEKDNGIYDAMNKGVSMAAGEWLYFMGSDDRLHNDSVLRSIFTVNKHDYDVVYGNVRIIGNTSWAADGDLYDGEFNLKKLRRKNICQQAIFYNKRCFTRTGIIFDTNYELCADWDFNFRCWAQKPFCYIDIVVADFFAGGASTRSNRDAYQYPKASKRLLHKWLTFMRYNRADR